MQKMHPQYGGAIRTIDSSPIFSVARYRIDKLYRELTTGGRKPRPRITFVISKCIGARPLANPETILAFAADDHCYTFLCSSNVVDVLRSTWNEYDVNNTNQL